MSVRTPDTEICRMEPVSCDAVVDDSAVIAQAENAGHQGAGDEITTEPQPITGARVPCWSWVVLLASLVMHVTTDGVGYSFLIFSTEFVDYFECSQSNVDGLWYIMSGCSICSAPIAGALIYKFGCRIVAISGTLIASFGFIISMWVPNIWFLYFSFGCVAGLGLIMMYLPAVVAVVMYFERCRCVAIGILMFGESIGTFLFAPLTNALLWVYGWKGTALIDAGIILQCILCGTSFRPVSLTQKLSPVEGRKRLRNRSEAQKPFKAVANVSSQIIIFSLYAISNLLASIGSVVSSTFLPVCSLHLGFTKFHTSLTISISAAIGLIVFMIIGDRKCVNRLLFYNTVLVICGVCSVINGFLWVYPLHLCYAFVFGFTIGVHGCLTPIIIIDLFGSQRFAMAYGLILFFSGIGGFAGPPLAGWLMYAISDSCGGPFCVMGVLYIVSGAILYSIPCIQQWGRKSRA